MTFALVILKFGLQHHNTRTNNMQNSAMMEFRNIDNTIYISFSLANAHTTNYTKKQIIFVI